MLIYQIFKRLEDGTPEILCAHVNRWKAEVILRDCYPDEKGKVVWLDVIRKEGKLRIVDGELIK